MLQWLQENWISATTLVASALAAIGSISAAITARKNYTLQQGGILRRTPSISCEMRRIKQQTDWYRLEVFITNLAELELHVKSAEIRKPKSLLICDPDIIFEIECRGIDGANEPLPHKHLHPIVPLRINLASYGSKPTSTSHGHKSMVSMFLYSDKETAFFVNQPPSIRFNLAWRENIAKTFPIVATINMINDS